MPRQKPSVFTLGLLGALLFLVISSAALFASSQGKLSRAASGSTKQATAKPAPGRSLASKQGRGKRARRVRRARGQRAPEPARIREIQQALIHRGYLAPPPTGKWDSASSEAMRRFQQEQGLGETGKFDAPSLIKLGLGPPTAGVAAPRGLTATGNNSNTIDKH